MRAAPGPLRRDGGGRHRVGPRARLRRSRRRAAGARRARPSGPAGLARGVEEAARNRGARDRAGPGAPRKTLGSPPGWQYRGRSERRGACGPAPGPEHRALAADGEPGGRRHRGGRPAALAAPGVRRGAGCRTGRPPRGRARLGRGGRRPPVRPRSCRALSRRSRAPSANGRRGRTGGRGSGHVRAGDDPPLPDRSRTALRAAAVAEPVHRSARPQEARRGPARGRRTPRDRAFGRPASPTARTRRARHRRRGPGGDRALPAGRGDGGGRGAIGWMPARSQGSAPRARAGVRPLSGVLLAAGASRRLGRPKQLLVWQGETLVRRAARAALEAGVDELVVVTGAECDAVAAELVGLDLRVVHNERWPEGIGTSIAAGVRAASGAAVLLHLADQPGVDAALLAELIAGMEAGHECVACAYGGGIGVPALFSAASDLDALRALSGDRGARPLLGRAGEAVLAIPAGQAAFDIDDAEDWRRWQDEGRRTGGAARPRPV